jgi:Fic family protein
MCKKFFFSFAKLLCILYVSDSEAQRLQGSTRRGMTGKRISAEQVKVMEVFTANPDGWFDSNQVERSAEVPGSTVRHFLFTFLQLGLLERLEMHGGYRYRLSPKAEAQPYFRRLQDAAAAIKP